MYCKTSKSLEKKKLKTQDPFIKNIQNIFIANCKHNDRHLQDILVHIYTYFFFFPRIKAVIIFKDFRAVSTAELQNSSVTSYETNWMV